MNEAADKVSASDKIFHGTAVKQHIDSNVNALMRYNPGREAKQKQDGKEQEKESEAQVSQIDTTKNEKAQKKREQQTKAYCRKLCF